MAVICATDACLSCETSFQILFIIPNIGGDNAAFIVEFQDVFTLCHQDNSESGGRGNLDQQLMELEQNS